MQQQENFFSKLEFGVFSTGNVTTGANKKVEQYDFPAFIMKQNPEKDAQGKEMGRRNFELNRLALELLGFKFEEASDKLIKENQYIAFQCVDNVVYLTKVGKENKGKALINRGSYSFTNSNVHQFIQDLYPYVKNRIDSDDVVLTIDKVDQDDAPFIICSLAIPDDDATISNDEERADSETDAYIQEQEETNLV